MLHLRFSGRLYGERNGRQRWLRLHLRLHSRRCDEHGGRRWHVVCLLSLRHRLLQDDFRRRSLRSLHVGVHGLVVRVRRLLDDDQPRLLHLCRRLLWHRLHYLQRRSRLRQRHGLGGQHRLRLRCRPDARRGLERSRRHWHAFRLHCLRYRLLQDCLGQLFVHGLRLCVRGGHELRVDCLLFNVKPRLRYVRGSLLWQHLRGDGVHRRCQPRLHCVCDGL